MHRRWLVGMLVNKRKLFNGEMAEGMYIAYGFNLDLCCVDGKRAQKETALTSQKVLFR